MERDLDDITRNLMTSRSSYSQSAREMGERAMAEEQLNSATTRSKRTVYEDTSEIGRAHV